MSKEILDLRNKNLEQLDAELAASRESQFNLRIKHKLDNLTKPIN